MARGAWDTRLVVNARGAVENVQEPEEAQPLTMALVAPAEIGTCRELVLEAVAEGGTAGRPVTWAWDSSEDFKFTATSEVRLSRLRMKN